MNPSLPIIEGASSKNRICFLSLRDKKIEIDKLIRLFRSASLGPLDLIYSNLKNKNKNMVLLKCLLRF